MISMVFRNALTFTALVLLLTALPVHGQTGPGGVGNASGTVGQPENTLWLRADQGVDSDVSGFAECFDQSGNGNDARPPLGKPELEASFSGFGGVPAIDFEASQKDLFEVADSPELDDTDEITIFSVVRADILDSNPRGIVTKRFDFDNQNNRNDDQYSYSTFFFQNNTFNFDVSSSGNRTVASPFSANTPYLFQARYSLSEGESQIYADGDLISTRSLNTTIADEPSTLRIGILKNGDPITSETNANRFYDGQMGEIIVYRAALNKAQRIIVNSYLANKYNLPTSGTEVRAYAYGVDYEKDVAGIGRAAPSDQHDFAQSSVLGFGVGDSYGASGFSADDRYIFIGHDGGAQADFSASSFSEPVNGLTANAARIDRTWRADFAFGAGSGPKSVTISVPTDSLPSRSPAANYFVIVDGTSETFDGTPEAYELTGSGTLTATIELSDGDYIAIGAGQRTLNLAASGGSVFENTTASPNASVAAQLNLPYTSSTNPDVDGAGTDVEVTFSSSGDLDESGSLEDDGVTNALGTNASGDYEADDGSGNDTVGGFNGDVRVTTIAPLVVPAGSDAATLNLEVDDDGIAEQTEKFAVEIEGVANALSGPVDRFLLSINDDDDPRDLTIVDTDDNRSVTENAAANPETFTIELDSDGNGETAAITSPFTSVEFIVDEGAGDVNVGTDFSDPTVDVRIVSETGSSGDEFQQRLSPTRGRVYFASGAASAQLKLEVNPDNVDDVDAEDIVIDLVNPVSAVLSQSPGNTDLLFTIQDDDAAPTAQFAQPLSGADEGASGTVEVTLSSISGRPVVVDYAIDTGNTSATEGPSNDFTTTPGDGTVQFASGTTSRFITIDTNQDSEDETDETVALDLEGNGTATTRPTIGATLGATTSHTFSIRDDDTPAIGTTGPGGVGEVNGTGQLALWLRADALTVNDGQPVATWPDASGRGNDASASGPEQPTFRAGARNGQPAVEFDGIDTRMTGEIDRGLSATYFAVGNSNTSSRNAFAEVHEDGGSTRNILFLRGGTDLNYYDGSGNQSGGTLSSNRFLIFGATHGGQNVRGFDNGEQVLSSTNATSNGLADAYIIGDDRTSDDHLEGRLTEYVVFERVLGEAQRTLVENYLSAKYDIDLNTSNGAVDVYAGDTGSNGDYDRGVFGIGRETADDFHSAGETDGLRFDASGGLGDGDYLMAGHRVADNQTGSDDISAPVVQRMQRVWFVSRTDGGTGLRSDVTFDLSKAGLSDLAGDPSNYVLLEQNPAGSGTFSAKVTGADAATDDQITFTDVSLTDGSGITLGTTDDQASPLSGTALTIIGTQGNEGDAKTGELGGDAGWRLIGPPVEDATAGDLISGSDTNGSVIEFTVAEGSMFYQWDDTIAGSPNDGAWSPINIASTAFQNGRGYLLFLFDDVGIPDADPLNPSITLDVATGTVTSSDVTVGDGTPASDPAFNRDARFLLLANPFNEPYDLTSLTDGNNNRLGTTGSQYQATVQIWDGGATTAEDGAQAGSYVTAAVNATMSQDGTGNMVLQPGSDVISAWQGFFVERTSPGGGGPQCSTPPGSEQCQLTFNSSGITTGDRRIVGSKSAGPDPSIRLPLKLTVTNGAGKQIARDEAASIYFHPDATEGWDGFDASKLQPLSGSYAVIGPVGQARGDSVKVKAVESRPRRLTEPVDVPIQLQTVGPVGGEAEIAANDWRGVPEEWTVILIDTQGTADPSDDTEHVLMPGTPYVFDLTNSGSKSRPQTVAKTSNIESDKRGRLGPPPRIAPLRTASQRIADGTRGKSAASMPSARFRLRVEPGSALPVEFAGIDAVTKERNVTLTWTTASETNNAGFTVEHRQLRVSPAGDTVRAGSWKRLGFVKGAGTSDASQTYRYETGELDYGPHAFRLRQVDTDGSMSLSDEVKADIILERAYAVEPPRPHPVRRQTTIDITVREAQPVTVEVYDVLGRRVAVPFEEKIGGQRPRRIRVDASGFSSGVYFVRVRGESFATTERMTVVK